MRCKKSLVSEQETIKRENQPTIIPHKPHNHVSVLIKLGCVAAGNTYIKYRFQATQELAKGIVGVTDLEVLVHVDFPWGVLGVFPNLVVPQKTVGSRGAFIDFSSDEVSHGTNSKVDDEVRFFGTGGIDEAGHVEGLFQRTQQVS